MSTRVPLPDGFHDTAFTVGEARAAGLSPSRLRGKDLQRPFWGLRAPAWAELDTPMLARTYAARMAQYAFFSHSTAAQLHGIPLSPRLATPLPLHVSVPDGSRSPRGREIRGHHLSIEPVDVITRRSLRMTSLERTLCDLAALLNDEELVAAGDNILWRKRLRGNRATPRSLASAISRFHGRRGRQRLIA